MSGADQFEFDFKGPLLASDAAEALAKRMNAEIVRIGPKRYVVSGHKKIAEVYDRGQLGDRKIAIK